jgi:hypothetical protein
MSGDAIYSNTERGVKSRRFVYLAPQFMPSPFFAAVIKIMAPSGIIAAGSCFSVVKGLYSRECQAQDSLIGPRNIKKPREKMDGR